MTIELKVDVTAFDMSVDRWIEKALQACSDGITAAGGKIADETRGSFNTGHGPHSRSGTLEASVVVAELKRQDDSGYDAQVGPSGVVYARRVELLHHGEHAYFKPGVERARPSLADIFRQHWQRAQGGV